MKKLIEENVKKLINGLFAAVVALSVSGSAEAKDLRILASWDQSYSAVGKVLLPFMDYLESNTTAKLGLTRMGPETVPPFEQLDPVARGLFDMLYTNGAYHFGETAVGMTLDAMKGDTEMLRKAGVWQYVDEQYQKLGLKLIAVLYDQNGYHIMLKEPLSDTVLEGLRIRGTPIYHPVIKALGGAPVVLPGSEIYPALERGVVDGAAWPTVGAVAYKWYEVADYMMRPSFGQSAHMVLMNLEVWNSLDETTRTEIVSAARKFELIANTLFDTIGAEEQKTLEAEGMKITTLNADSAAKLNKAWFTGSLDLAATKNPVAVEKVRELAANGGLGG